MKLHLLLLLLLFWSEVIKFQFYNSGHKYNNFVSHEPQNTTFRCVSTQRWEGKTSAVLLHISLERNSKTYFTRWSIDITLFIYDYFTGNELICPKTGWFQSGSCLSIRLFLKTNRLHLDHVTCWFHWSKHFSFNSLLTDLERGSQSFHLQILVL